MTVIETGISDAVSGTQAKQGAQVPYPTQRDFRALGDSGKLAKKMWSPPPNETVPYGYACVRVTPPPPPPPRSMHPNDAQTTD